MAELLLFIKESDEEGIAFVEEFSDHPLLKPTDSFGDVIHFKESEWLGWFSLCVLATREVLKKPVPT